MGTRGRRAIVAAPVAVTVLLAALVGGFVVVSNQRQAERIGRADDIGADYLSAVATFRTSVLDAVGDAPKGDPGAQRKALRAAVAEPPVLPEIDGGAVAESTTYAQAEKVQAELLDPYESLDASLKKADVALDFVAAAREVLDLRVSDYIDGTLLSSSAQLRTSLIPAFVEARDTFAEATVPKGQQDLADTVRGAAQYVIDQATRLADSIDANRSFSFTYATQFNAAITAVDDYATQVQGDLTEQLNRLEDLSA